MASVRRKPHSKYWVACYTDAAGKQRQRSTRETRRPVAQKIAEKLESIYRKKLTVAQARKVVSDIYEEVRGDALQHATVREFFTTWLQHKKAELAPGSYKRYETAIEKLIDYLGERADLDVAFVEKADLLALRDKTAEQLSPSTANTDLKIFRSALRQAVVDGIRLDNPALAVSLAKDVKPEDAPTRRPFTDIELKQLLTIARGEWRGMILAGAYTGQRLGDIAALTWKRVDLERKLITIRPRKTAGRKKIDAVIIPIAPMLLDYLKEVPRGNADAAVFPNASQEKIEADGESRRLSAQFHELLVEAKLATPRPKNKNSGRGHSVRRTVSELSFHSLRHTATTWLKLAGVPEAVVRDIIGHESTIVSRGYTHVDEESKRKAVAAMPTLKEKPLAIPAASEDTAVGRPESPSLNSILTGFSATRE